MALYRHVLLEILGVGSVVLGVLDAAFVTGSRTYAQSACRWWWLWCAGVRAGAVVVG